MPALFFDAQELLLFQPAKNQVLSLRIGIGSINKLLRSLVVFVGVEIMTNYAVIKIWRHLVGIWVSILNIMGRFSCNLLIFAHNEGPMVMLRKDLTASTPTCHSETTHSSDRLAFRCCRLDYYPVQPPILAKFLQLGVRRISQNLILRALISKRLSNAIFEADYANKHHCIVRLSVVELQGEQ